MPSSCSSGWPWARLPYSYPTKMPAFPAVGRNLLGTHQVLGMEPTGTLGLRRFLEQANEGYEKQICWSWQGTWGEDP